jgi:hypothetical protein
MSNPNQMDTSANNPLNASPRPAREINSGVNLDPISSPPPVQEGGGITESPLARRKTETLLRDEDEFEPLLFRTDQLVEMKRSDHVPLSHLLSEQDKYMVAFACLLLSEFLKETPGG